MKDKEEIIQFADGNLQWDAARLSADELRKKYLHENWHDGFVAFSTTEERLGSVGMENLRRFLTGKAGDQGGPEGFMMEAGCWRNNGTKYEELAIEREGDSFFVQHWQLDIANPPNESVNCYFRVARTFVRGNIDKEVFPGELETFEVIVPCERLRFYITKGE